MRKISRALVTVLALIAAQLAAIVGLIAVYLRMFDVT